LASDAVITAKILDANVTLAKIASQAANTVIVRDANSSGVLSAKALATTQILIGDGTGFTAAALSGNVTMTNAGVATLATATFTGASELSGAGSAPAATDMFLMYDASAATFKKISGTTLGHTWTELAGNVTTTVGARLLVDTSSARTVTLPASPVIGDTVRIVDGTGQAGTNNITVARNSQKIQGASADLTIGTNRAGIGLVFYNATHGWLLIDN
jgi:hypothetical protein